MCRDLYNPINQSHPVAHKQGCHDEETGERDFLCTPCKLLINNHYIVLVQNLRSLAGDTTNKIFEIYCYCALYSI